MGVPTDAAVAWKPLAVRPMCLFARAGPFRVSLGASVLSSVSWALHRGSFLKLSDDFGAVPADLADAVAVSHATTPRFGGAP